MKDVEPLQGTLLGAVEPRLAPEPAFERLELDDRSWVDISRGWLLGADTLLEQLVDEVPWRQYRRVDGYLSPAPVRIVANPGEVASGRDAVETWSFHRPIQSYVKACAGAGLLIDRLEEWPSLRVSTSGPRAEEENRARREIPMFLGVRAVKPPAA